MKTKTIIMVIILVFISTLVFAEDHKFVKRVKTSTLTGCELTTLGAIFNAPNFDEAKWDHFEASSGVYIVEFTGKISQRLHNKAAAYVKENSNPSSLYNIARSNITDEEFEKAYASKKESSWEAVRTAISDYWLDNYVWKAGSDTKVQFIIKGESFNLGITKNKTWPQSANDVFKILCM